MRKVQARPQPAQIDAIHRLARQGRPRAAQGRLAALRQAFPGYKPLLALAWEIANDAGDRLGATLAAWDWSRASPNSPAAWEALLESAGLSFAALSLQAMRRLDALAGLPDQPEPEPMPNPFGDLGFEQARALDAARLLLSGNRPAEARAALAGIDHVSAHNNLALVAFAEGKVLEAKSILLESTRREPDNLFGVERLARMALWTGGLEAAAGLGPRRGAARLARERLDLASGPMSKIRGEITEAEADRDTPDWTLGQIADWWPLSSIERMRALRGEDEAARYSLFIALFRASRLKEAAEVLEGLLHSQPDSPAFWPTSPWPALNWTSPWSAANRWPARPTPSTQTMPSAASPWPMSCSAGAKPRRRTKCCCPS